MLRLLQRHAEHAGNDWAVRVLRGEEHELGWTPAHAAADQGHAACLRLLVASPMVDLVAEDHGGNTPVHLAASAGRHRAVAAVLALKEFEEPLGWDKRLSVLGRHNMSGQTPLACAIAEGRPRCVAGLDEGLLPLSPSNLLYIENSYVYKNSQ